MAHIVEEIRANEGEAMAVKTDVAEAASVETVIKRAIDAYGRLDIAVNNASIAGGNTPLVEVTEELFDRIIATNLKGVFLSTRTQVARGS